MQCTTVGNKMIVCYMVHGVYNILIVAVWFWKWSNKRLQFRFLKCGVIYEYNYPSNKLQGIISQETVMFIVSLPINSHLETGGFSTGWKVLVKLSKFESWWEFLHSCRFFSLKFSIFCSKHETHQDVGSSIHWQLLHGSSLVSPWSVNNPMCTQSRLFAHSIHSGKKCRFVHPC
jgi:hypothetical protein